MQDSCYIVFLNVMVRWIGLPCGPVPKVLQSGDGLMDELGNMFLIVSASCPVCDNRVTGGSEAQARGVASQHREHGGSVLVNSLSPAEWRAATRCCDADEEARMGVLGGLSRVTIGGPGLDETLAAVDSIITSRSVRTRDMPTARYVVYQQDVVKDGSIGRPRWRIPSGSL